MKWNLTGFVRKGKFGLGKGSRHKRNPRKYVKGNTHRQPAMNLISLLQLYKAKCNSSHLPIYFQLKLMDHISICRISNERKTGNNKLCQYMDELETETGTNGFAFINQHRHQTKTFLWDKSLFSSLLNVLCPLEV